MSHNMFWKDPRSADLAPISFSYTSFIPVRNRCAKPVARAAAFVLIAFVRGFYCISVTWLWNQ